MSELFFVYGTLTDDGQVANLLDSYRFVGDAVCVGLRRIDGRYPTLVPGDRVTGRLLATDETDRLDRYEGVDRGLYYRFSVPVVDEGDSAVPAEAATVYIGEPAGLGIDPAADTGWPGSEAFTDRVGAYLASNPVRIVSLR